MFCAGFQSKYHFEVFHYVLSLMTIYFDFKVIITEVFSVLMRHRGTARVVHPTFIHIMF